MASSASSSNGIDCIESGPAQHECHDLWAAQEKNATHGWCVVTDVKVSLFLCRLALRMLLAHTGDETWATLFALRNGGVRSTTLPLIVVVETIQRKARVRALDVVCLSHNQAALVEVRVGKIAEN